jgi:hypothetical protein
VPDATTPPRIIHVPPERLDGWIERFGARHGGIDSSAEAATVILTAADGAVAILTVPFAPLPPGDPVTALVDHALQARSVGSVLIRRGGFAVGIFDGRRLVASKVGSSYVQGKTKAGGWSQQRYARRRANQASQAYAEAADVVAMIILPRIDDLDAVVGGGDRAGIEAALSDPRLASVHARWTGEVWPTPDPRLRVLQGFPDQFRAVAITLNDLA